MPGSVRHALGLELMRVQYGGEPLNFKPMVTVGAGAYELRVRDDSGAFRVIYVAKFADAVYVLHAFQKKSKSGIATPQKEIELIKSRLQRALEHHAGKKG